DPTPLSWSEISQGQIDRNRAVARLTLWRDVVVEECTGTGGGQRRTRRTRRRAFALESLHEGNPTFVRLELREGFFDPLLELFDPRFHEDELEPSACTIVPHPPFGEHSTHGQRQRQKLGRWYEFSKQFRRMRDGPKPSPDVHFEATLQLSVYLSRLGDAPDIVKPSQTARRRRTPRKRHFKLPTEVLGPWVTQEVEGSGFGVR